MLKVIFKWKWIIMAILCFLLLKVLPSSFIEQYYSLGIFLSIRKFFDDTLGRLPFPSYYLFMGVMLIIAMKWILHFFKARPQAFLHRMFKVLSFAGFMTILFFILWGFNYGRISLGEKLHLNSRPLTVQQLASETMLTANQLSEARKKIQKDTGTIPEIVFINNIEENSRRALNTTLNGFGFPGSNVRGRFVFEDLFLFFNVGGQYLPYVGESNVDEAVYYSKKPFYLIHEMAHGNGFTEESDCNFLAYISCLQSGNLSLRYSGELNYLLYLLYELKDRDEPAYNACMDAMSPGIRKDLEEMKKYDEKHRFKTGVVGDVVNNLYLKLLGVKEGTKNYDKMVAMIYAWKNQ